MVIIFYDIYEADLVGNTVDKWSIIGYYIFCLREVSEMEEEKVGYCCML